MEQRKEETRNCCLAAQASRNVGPERYCQKSGHWLPFLQLFQIPTNQDERGNCLDDSLWRLLVRVPNSLSWDSIPTPFPSREIQAVGSGTWHLFLFLPTRSACQAPRFFPKTPYLPILTSQVPNHPGVRPATKRTHHVHDRRTDRRPVAADPCLPSA
jgi:hypothetical protein